MGEEVHDVATEKEQDEGQGGKADRRGPGAAGGDLGGRAQSATPPPTRADDPVVTRTRTASLFVTAAVGLVLALLMLVFVLQNGDRQRLEFLWFDFTLPAGAAMLLAAIVGGLIVALLGLGRVVQLRLAARRHRWADRRSG